MTAKIVKGLQDPQNFVAPP